MTISTNQGLLRKAVRSSATAWLSFCIMLIGLLGTFQANAQFSIAATGTNYTENFNSLANTGASNAWSNNSTLTGWYARTDNTASITTYGANTGSTTGAGLYSYGVAGTNAITERALGYATSNTFTGSAGTGRNYLGWRLVNNTGAAIASINVTWTGEQWRRDNTVAQSLVLTYQQGATVTALTGGTWTAASSTFTSPQIVGAAAALDGNAAVNRSAGISVTITVNIPAGQEIMLRWEDLNDAGNDHQLAIDDVTIIATPAAAAPTVTTTVATGISNGGFSSGGEVTANGGASVTARGLAYGTSANPTISGTITSDGSGLGTFTSTVGSLAVNTQYFYRAYATNIGGTGYGAEFNLFTLANTPTAPTVGGATSASLDVTIGGADGNPSGTQYAIRETGSGNFVQGDGSLAATEVWNTASGWGTKTVTGLAASTSYTFEVKARNGANVETAFGASTTGTTSGAGAQNQTISFGPLSNVTYGDAPFNLTATASSGLTVTYMSSNTNVATISGNTVTIVGAGSANITASQAGDGGVLWNPAPDVIQPLTVLQKELTVSGAAAQNKTFDGNTNAVISGGVLVGVVGGDDVSLTGGGTFATAGAGTAISVTANLSLAGSDAGNYTLTQPTGLSADILQASQTITFNALPVRNTLSAPFNLTATASSGLPVSYSSSNPLVATIGGVNGNTVTIVGGGSTIITASQGGNANYLPAANVNQTQLVINAVLYTFGTVAPGVATPTSGTPISNLTVSALSRGNNNGTTTLLTTTSGSTGYTGASGSFNAGAAALNAALNTSTSTYFEFTLTPAVAHKVTVSAISFGARSTSTGPQAYYLRSSLDNYASDLATGAIPNTSTWVLRSNSFSAAGAFGQAVTFRLYGATGAGTPSLGTANWRIDDINLSLFVEAAPNCSGTPEAGTAAGGTTLCTGNGTNITLSGNTDINSANGLSIQWFRSTDNNNFSPVGVGNETTLATGNLTQTTYYYAQVTCSVSGLFDVTNTETVIVNPNVNAGAITGPSAMCVGTTIPFTSNGDAGGTWASSNPLVASVDGLGNVTALTAGSTNITYSILSGCGAPSVATQPVATAVNAAPVVTGLVNVCSAIQSAEQVTYTATTPGATSFNWIVPPTNVTVIGTTNNTGVGTITVVFQNGFQAQANKQLRVTASSVCGTSPLAIYYLAAQLPTTPQPISGPVSACPFIGSGTATYSIPAVSAAATYNWTVPAGASIQSGQGTTSITVSFSNSYATGAITVNAQNTCGVSGLRSLTVTRANPGTPGLISGPTNVCAFISPSTTAATYSVASAPAVTAYNWTLPAGATSIIGQGTNTISFIYPGGYTGGSISVVASNGCGSSAARSLAVTTLAPATPSPIDVQLLSACPNRQYSYTLASLPANATSVNWTVPAGATIESGQGTISITVSYPGTSVNGAVTAQSVSNCGVSAIRSVEVKLPACPLEFTKGTNIVQLPTASVDVMDVKVFPNPSVSDFRLQVQTGSKEIIHVRVLDMSGREYKLLQMMPGETLSLGGTLKAGTYVIEVLQGNRRAVRKIVKM